MRVPGFSKSLQSGEANFLDFVDNNGSFLDNAAEGPEGETMKSDLREAIADGTNVAVFSSRADPDGDDSPESCAYFAFYVLREDGTAAHFDFDYRD